MATMMKQSVQYRFDTENQAMEFIKDQKEKSMDEIYTITKSGYTRKEKKAKGEVIAEAFVVDITYNYSGLWDDLMGD